MAGGTLTPRQKMINMMYLVLTAMLALNVSAEVLDAFVEIDKGIENNTRIVAEKNDSNLAEFRTAAAENKEKVEPWLLKGEEVHLRATALYDKINQIKIDVITTGDGNDTESITDGTIDASAIDDKANTDASSRIMLGVTGMKNGHAYVLHDAMNGYCNYLVSLIDETQDPSLVHTLNELLRLPDKVSKTDGEVTSWEVATFDGIPLISAVALLSKMQMDVYNSENEVVSYLIRQVTASDFKFSDIDVAIIPSSKYVIRGTEFSAEIFFAAYDPSLKPTLTLGGRTFSAGEKGKILYTAIPDRVGVTALQGSIELGKDTYPVNLSYTVIDPNIVVSPEKMNVMYRGIDNPVKVSLSGVSQDEINVQITNATHTRAGNIFNVRPGKERTCEISVWNNGKNMGAHTLRVKDLPAPSPVLDGISGKTAKKSDLLASQGILAQMPRDFDFDLRFRVVSFSVFAAINGYAEEASSNAAAFTPEQQRLFSRLRPGDRVSFTDIKAMGPDGRTVELNDISIKLK
ncbi:MAG: gliding motility protein GldM [Prevotellaceae bacterium]|jgi:gliding motility-associated protein GldM|nr:gliding motility protein GldM [Prevotellaceae bacterium]